MNTVKLPPGYSEIKIIDPVGNSKEALAVNLISVALTVVMLLLGASIYGFDRLDELLLTDNAVQLRSLAVKLAVCIAACAVSAFLHELIHGAAMKCFCRQCRLSLKFRFMGIYIESNAYYDRVSYNIIAAAPEIIIGVACIAACCAVPAEWFWTPYLVLSANILACAGDIYVFSIVLRMPKDILLSYTGAVVRINGK